MDQFRNPGSAPSVPALPEHRDDETVIQANDAALSLPPRVKVLHSELLSNIPALPGSEAALASLNFGKTMLTYVNWAARFIKPRKRSISYAPDFWRSEAAVELGGEVLNLEGVIKSGVNLTPYLSSRVVTDGFMSPTTARGGKGLRWEDKDFALNAYGVHHLHFRPAASKNRGSSLGKNGPLLYAEFAPHVAFMLMVGDHKSFDNGTLHEAVINARAAAGRFELVGLTGPDEPTAGITEEVGLARRGISTVGFKDGRAFIGASVSTAGTSPFHSGHASRILRALHHWDPKLDEAHHWQSLFTNAGRPVSERADWSWHMEYTELSAIEHHSKTKFIIVNGLN